MLESKSNAWLNSVAWHNLKLPVPKNDSVWSQFHLAAPSQTQPASSATA